MASFDASAFVAQLTTLPGVYQMRDVHGELLYVGKARNLKNRVSSYFRGHHPSAKTRRLVQLIASIDVTITHTEGEALLLESTLIKRHQPRFNVLLRDNKGYPYIQLTSGNFPRLRFYRGAKRSAGRYFGPYPSTAAVRETLEHLQKAFKLRLCEDSVFRNRSRPCLQHQMKRCSAACTQLISTENYQQDVANAVAFLEGKSSIVINDLVARMEVASANLAFEEAARLRDQIAQLRRIQERQYVSREGQGEVDVVAAELTADTACVQVFYFRDGQLLGNKAFFPTIPEGADLDELLTAFLSQYYAQHPIPHQIIVDRPLSEAALLTAAFSDRRGRKIELLSQVRGERAKWQEMAARNASLALKTQLATRSGLRQRLSALQQVLDLPNIPQRIECFDISHTLGEATIAACVVFNQEGPQKSDYRRYNIQNIVPGDDYAAMHQALTRRFTRALNEQTSLPDLLLIDGGLGQLNQAVTVLNDLQISTIFVVGVAKGAERIVGRELLHLPHQAVPIELGSDHPALHLIQQVRDEAHRFAITGHRQRRAKTRNESPLEGIEGIGPKRRQQLLKQFGGLQGLKRAGIEDLASIRGINQALAQRIYDALHEA